MWNLPAQAEEWVQRGEKAAAVIPPPSLVLISHWSPFWGPSPSNASPPPPPLVWGYPLGRAWPMAKAVTLLCANPTQGSETAIGWGTVRTTDPAKGRECREVRIGQAGRSRALGGEGPMGTPACGGRGFEGRAAVSGRRPIGAASFRQLSIQASTPPPPLPPGLQRDLRSAVKAAALVSMSDVGHALSVRGGGRAGHRR